MKKVISLLLICMMMLSMVTAVSATNVCTVSVDSVDASSATIDDVIVVPVRLDAVPDGQIRTVGIEIKYDTTKLSFVKNTSFDQNNKKVKAMQLFDTDMEDLTGASVTITGNDSSGLVKLAWQNGGSTQYITSESIENSTALTFLQFKKKAADTKGEAALEIMVVGLVDNVSNGEYSLATTPNIIKATNGVVTLSTVTKYDITHTQGTGYTTNLATGEKVKAEGDSVSFTVTPDEGYQIDSVKMNGADVSVNEGTYSFTMPAGAANVVVTASKAKYALTKGAEENGTITLSPAEGQVEWGTNVTVTATPATGYQVKAIKVNGVEKTATFEMPKEPAEVTVEFEKVTYVLNVEENTDIDVADLGEGTIAFATENVKAGENFEFTVTAPAGYYVGTVDAKNEAGESVLAVPVLMGATETKTATMPMNGKIKFEATYLSTDSKIKSITVNGQAVTVNDAEFTGTVALETFAENATIVVETAAGAEAVIEGAVENVVELVSDPQDVVITVTSEAGTTDTYTITIDNAVNPAEDASIEAITVNGVAATINGTSATVALDVYTEGMVVVVDVDTTVDGADVVVNDGNEIELIEGETVTVDVVVTALDGFTTETYILAISTEADPFAHDATIEAITVNNKAATINGTAATVSLNVYAQAATVVVDTTVDEATYVITAPAEFVVGNNVYTIEVTAKDGVTTETYTLTVTNPAQATGRPSSAVGGGSTAPTLSDVKNNVRAKLDKATDDLNKDEYSEEAWAEIEKLVEDAKAKLEEAKNVKAAEKIEKELLAAIEEVKTLDEEEPAEDVEIPVDETIEPAVISAPEKTEEEIAAAEALYSDMADHWALAYIHELSVANSVFKGNEDGTFAPDKGITRQEIAVALGRLLGLEEIAAEVTATDFTDDAEIADWAKGYVAVMNELGLLKGNADGSFAANDVITREQLALILSRMVEAPEAVAGMAFDDVSGISDWAAEGCAIAYTFGIVKGYPDNTFKGANTVTRAEAVVMIYNYLAAIAD